MHDVAISAWGIKGYYDYPRPISVIRYLSEKGQSSYPDSINYNPNGIKLIDNYIETVGPQDPLVGDNNENLGKIKLYTWKGFTDNSVSEKKRRVQVGYLQNNGGHIKDLVLLHPFCRLCFRSLNLLKSCISNFRKINRK